MPDSSSEETNPKREPMFTRRLRKTIIITIGWLFLIVGIIGFVIPIFQGFIFVIAGVLLLSVYSPFFQRLSHKFASKHPKAEYWVRKIEDRLKRFLE